MKLNLLMNLSLFLFGVFLFLPNARAGLTVRRRRQTSAVDVSKLMSRKDLERLESAVRAEIKANNGDPGILTPEKLDQLVEEHSQKLPWYKRLWRRFRDALPDIITAVAATVLKSFVAVVVLG